MNIYTVRDNLKKTIEGKEELLTNLKGKRIPPEATIKFLEINIDELKRILVDVETCCEQASEQSWALNPDRSGGQFTQDELYNHNRDGWIEP